MHVRVIYRRDRYLRGGDHIPFLEQGYPAARFTEPNEDFAHQHQDVRVENGVQFGDLPRVLRLRLHRARGPGQRARRCGRSPRRPARPRDVGIVTSALTNDTELMWERGTEPDLAGYEVVWRETTEPEWTQAIKVGDVTSATIDLSKDNVFFGVRAVDRAGHRSPVSYPTPAA